MALYKPRGKMIYLVKATNTNYYKIGFSNNIKKRIKSLQTGCPTKLKIVFINHGCMKKEEKIQEIFKDYKVRENAEWFEFSNDKILNEAINQIKKNYFDNTKKEQKYFYDMIDKKLNKRLIEDVKFFSDEDGIEDCIYIKLGKRKETPERKRMKEKKNSMLKEINKKFKYNQKNGKYSNEEHNAKQREWYKWRKRAEKVGVPRLDSRRPTPEERKKWQNKIIEKEKRI